MLLSLPSINRALSKSKPCWDHSEKVKCGRNTLATSISRETVVNTDVDTAVPLMKVLQGHNDPTIVAGRESKGICDQVSTKRSNLKLETGNIAVYISTYRLSINGVSQCFN